MSRNRLGLLLAVLSMAVVAVGGFFLAVQPQLSQTAAARSQTETVDRTNDASRTELARLQAQAADLPKMRRELSTLSASVPDEARISEFIRELNAVAAASGTQVTSFTASDAVAYSPAVSTGATGAQATSTPTSAATAEPSASATAAVPQAPAAPSVVTNAAINGRDFSVIPVTVSVDGSFDQALAFVKGVQGGQRLFLIDSITSSQKSGDDGAASTSSTWTFGGSIYVLDRAGDASTAGPAATPAAG